MVILAVLAQGCAALPVQREPAVGLGRLAAQPGRPGLVIGAPRETSEDQTGLISADLARRTGFGLVIATGYHEAYVSRVREVAQGPLSLYVEVHGSVRQEGGGRIEIATVGVDRQDAWMLKTLLELIRDSHLRGRPEIPRLDVLVEPLDRLSVMASSAKQAGIVRPPERAIHIELPRVARTLGRQAYTDVLADFLTQASRLLLAKER